MAVYRLSKEDYSAAAPGDADVQRLVFRRVRNEINERIRLWVTMQGKLLKEAGRAG
jgi:hypothetical protein